jgi:hypothetical protein
MLLIKAPHKGIDLQSWVSYTTSSAESLNALLVAVYYTLCPNQTVSFDFGATSRMEC